MEDLIGKLLSLAPLNLYQTLPKEVEFCTKSLITDAEDTARHATSTSLNDVTKALFKIQAVLDLTWEQLNTGHWSDVPLYLRHVYTIASFIKLVLLIKQHTSETSTLNRNDTLSAAMKAADMGLLLGAPLPPASGGCLKKAAALISTEFAELNQPKNTETFPDKEYSNENDSLSERLKGKPILRLQRPSLERFRKEHFESQTPVILTDCMGHWPALERWQQPQYLKQVAGARTVPVELGARYTDEEWRQRLMSFNDFIDKHVLGRDPEVGYLAQHPLFEQVPELKADIREPDYCCVSCSNETLHGDTKVNAWFGPPGTVSPLHFDPKHNLLAQVVGSKRVYLFAPSDSDRLYPHDDRLLFNTSRVDPERPDVYRFPLLGDAQPMECVLRPGEMLYIPPTWWHHVRALTTSFSVSFWWS